MLVRRADGTEATADPSMFLDNSSDVVARKSPSMLTHRWSRTNGFAAVEFVLTAS
jgi:hypothetical protein